MLTVEGQIWPKNGSKLIQMVKNISSTSKRQTRPPFHTVQGPQHKSYLQSPNVDQRRLYLAQNDQIFANFVQFG